jgi:hypothetical protein
MTMASIRKYYKVPTKRGARILYTGGKQPATGVITSALPSGLKFRARLDGEKFTRVFHPTWEITYLPPPNTHVNTDRANAPSAVDATSPQGANQSA